MAVGLQTKRETPPATPPAAVPPVAAPDEFERDFQRFKELSDRAVRRMPLKWEDRRPCLGERTERCAFDRHYVYHTAWAARVLAILNPKLHVDISSSLYFSAIASAFVPVDYYEYRPVKLSLDNFRSRTADLLALPFRDKTVPSLSCMHAVEHVGLGRYGDPLDAEGDLKAMAELQRVLAPGGSLIFVVPVGKPRVAFNAHRIYGFGHVVDAFEELELEQFAVVPDGRTGMPLLVNPPDGLADAQSYGCGCFWFRRPS
jgi:SAM-dependent methyltransferase